MTINDEQPSANVSKQMAAAYNELEYHQARVLLLVNEFARGSKGSLEGLTKLAKLDFLLRYPKFMERLLPGRSATWTNETRPTEAEYLSVESRMIRYKYGPWDDRYYQIVGALVGRSLLEYVPSRGILALRPTPLGRRIARDLSRDEAWHTVAARAALLRKHLNLTGNRLKEIIYSQLPDAVDRPWGEEI